MSADFKDSNNWQNCETTETQKEAQDGKPKYSIEDLMKQVCFFCSLWRIKNYCFSLNPL